MKAFETAAHALRDTMGEADCKDIPTVTITFKNPRDRAYFEMTVRRQLDPITAFAAYTYQTPHQFELCGVTYKLALETP